MVSAPTPLRQAQEAIDRMTRHLADLGVPDEKIQTLIADTDPGRCDDRRGFSSCQLDLGHVGRHLVVWPPDPGVGTKTQTEWALGWSDHDHKKHTGYDVPFFLPDASTPAMRAHAELVDDERVFICQPVTGTLLYVHIRLGRRDTGLHTWLRRIGLNREQAKRTKNGDYLARGQCNGARVALIAHAIPTADHTGRPDPFDPRPPACAPVPLRGAGAQACPWVLHPAESGARACGACPRDGHGHHTRRARPRTRAPPAAGHSHPTPWKDLL